MVPLPAIDLIALDLDGTLLDPNDDVSPGNRRALRAAIDAGVRVVLVTGRGAIDVPVRVVRDLRLNLPTICAHGALTKDFLSGRTLGHIPLPLAHARAMLEHAQRRRLNVAVYVEDCFFRLAGAPPDVENLCGLNAREVASLVDVLKKAPPTFVRFLGPHAVESARQAFSDLPLHFKHEVWDGFEECAVTSLEATKELALRRLCGDLDIPASRVLAIGDSSNDLPMLQWAGTGVVMGNALAEVRRTATRVTARCEEDGVARAIERYVLSPRAVPAERSA